ncbi:MAG: hypothetical protein IT260_11275 [Saprospiraceae bacterium]|nr:hypothetical protein [Saprospiraceae bacterium]
MKWSELEQDMQRRADAHELPVDTDALWNRIREKRRRRGLFWWLASAVLLTGLLVLLFGRSGKNFPTAGEQTPLPAAARQAPEPLGATPKAQPRETLLAPSLPDLPPNTPASPPAVLHLPKAPALRPQAAVRAAESHSAPSAEWDFGKQPAERAPLSPAASVPHPESPALSVEPAGEWGHAALGALQAPVLSLLHSSRFPLPVPLPLRPVNRSPVGGEGPPPDLKTQKNRPALGLQAGYFCWQARQAPADTLSWHKPLETVSGGLFVHVPLGRQWAVQAGISYARSTRLLFWESRWKDVQPKAVPQYFANGMVDTSYVPVAVELRRQVRQYHHWTQVSIPLRLHYQFAAGKGQLAPHLGLQASRLWAVGMVMDTSQHLNAGLFAARYPQKYMVQALAGLDWTLPLSTHWSIALGIQAQADLKPRNSPLLPEQERFWQYGLQLGLLRRLD